jgi:hypothetical protein
MSSGDRDFSEGQSRAGWVDGEGNPEVRNDDGPAVFGAGITPEAQDTDLLAMACASRVLR